MIRSRVARFSLSVIVLALLGATPALAQEFFMIVNGRVTGADGINAATGDRVIASIDGQTVSAQLDASGQFEGLTIIRSVNTADTITFSFRKGSTTYALVLAEGDTQSITEPYAGFNNPLSAAFSPTTINGVIGPRISGGGGDGNPQPGGNESDRADVDGDGLITTNDARLVLRFIVGMREGVTDAAVFDVNSDGVINTNDVIAILRREGEEALMPPSEGEEGGEGEGN